MDDTEPRFLVIGEVVKPHGVRGEMRVAPHTDDPQRFLVLERVFVGRTEPRPYGVTAVRFHQNQVLLSLEGVTTRDAAEALRGSWLQVPLEEAVPLEEGEYYLYELEGLDVYTDTGEHIGELVEVIETKANNVFVVQGERGEILLPDIDEVIREIDFENGRVTVHLLPGLQP